MDPSIQLFIILVVVGLFLIGAEIFLPGGVIGFLGGLSLFGAAVVGFKAFGPQGGIISALLIILLAGVCMVVWIRFFPRTGIGRTMTLSLDGKSFKSAPADLKTLVDKEGVAQSRLRPAGIARIDSHRVDVVAEGSWIESGRPIRVIRVEGNRILVREITAPAKES